jgi:peptidoglycan hydrolase-like protein with peptidoglycan-binding domain
MAGTPEGASVARALRGQKIKTVIGEIRFDRKGDRSDLEPLFVWYTWRNGSYVELDPDGGKRLGLVCRVQAGLGALNYDVIWADGLLGPFTRNSIEEFYKRKGKTPLRTIDEAMATEIEQQVTYEANSVREKDPSYERKAEVFRQWKKLGMGCRAQAGLKVLGHYHGELDGYSGSLTRTAIRTFKSARGISDRSVDIDEDLLQEIDRALDRHVEKALVAP